MVRAFGWYVAPSGLATTPSRPAPSNRLNHCSASSGSVVVRVRWTGRYDVAPAPPRGGRGAPRTARPSATRRRAPAGRTRRTRPASSRPASAPGSRPGGCAPASFSNSSRSPIGDEDLAVEHAPLGQRRLHRLDDLGEVAGQRLGVAAGQLDLVAVAEDDGTGTRPTWARRPARRASPGRGCPSRTWRASAGREASQGDPRRCIVGSTRCRSSLTERDPRVPADRLVAELVPPPRFADVSFDTYRPDPAQPSQTQAVEMLREFAATVGERPREAAASAGAGPPEGPGGVYLDGGYGVGKTHLLASLWHAAPAPEAVRHLRRADAPGRRARLPRPVEALSSTGWSASTSSSWTTRGTRCWSRRCWPGCARRASGSPPRRTRCPASSARAGSPPTDFLREIQGLSAHFESVRIDGEDYRHRGLPDAPAAPDLDDGQAGGGEGRRQLRRLRRPAGHLAQVHPSSTARCSTGSASCASRTCARSPTRRWRCGWWCSPTGCTTATCRWWPAACRSTAVRGAAAGRRLPQEVLPRGQPPGRAGPRGRRDVLATRVHFLPWRSRR